MIYLTGDELQLILDKYENDTDDNPAFLNLVKESANAASEKAQRMVAWGIVDWLHQEAVKAQECGYYLKANMSRKLQRMLEKHLLSQGVKRSGE